MIAKSTNEAEIQKMFIWETDTLLKNMGKEDNLKEWLWFFWKAYNIVDWEKTRNVKTVFHRKVSKNSEKPVWRESCRFFVHFIPSVFCRPCQNLAAVSAESAKHTFSKSQRRHWFQIAHYQRRDGSYRRFPRFCLCSSCNRRPAASILSSYRNNHTFHLILFL